LGQLHDDIALKDLYSAVDIAVVPSSQENLSNAIMESMACGTPVVGFNIGGNGNGNGDLIDHQQNGYLANPFDTGDLAKGIEVILNSKKYTEFCQSARNKVLREFDSRIVANQHIDLYEQLIGSLAP
jgi:glycosyltransferase involved in cell wall biosynthesis